MVELDEKKCDSFSSCHAIGVLAKLLRISRADCKNNMCLSPDNVKLSCSLPLATLMLQEASYTYRRPRCRRQLAMACLGFVG